MGLFGDKRDLLDSSVVSGIEDVLDGAIANAHVCPDIKLAVGALRCSGFDSR